MKLSQVQVCRFCGCFEHSACGDDVMGTCSWLERGRCSFCALETKPAPQLLHRARRLLAWWWYEAGGIALVSRGRRLTGERAELALVTLPVRPAHRHVVNRAFHEYVPIDMASATSAHFAFDANWGKWVLAGPLFILSANLLGVQRALQGRALKTGLAPKSKRATG